MFMESNQHNELLMPHRIKTHISSNRPILYLVHLRISPRVYDQPLYTASTSCKQTTKHDTMRQPKHTKRLHWNKRRNNSFIHHNQKSHLI